MLLEVAGSQGILVTMRSLFSLLLVWKLIPRAERFFQVFASGSQKSPTLEWPAFTKALPSLLPLSPKGLLSWFVMRGLLKTGCLSTSAALVGSDLLKPGLTFIQALKMLFHREVKGLVSFVAANSQLMSYVTGPSPCTGSITWLALCLRSSFQGSPPGSRPLMRSFAKRASD